MRVGDQITAPEQGIAGRTDSIPQMVARLREEISQYCPSRASQIQIMITETNAVSYNPGKQTISVVNALYLDDDDMTWLEHGVATVAWWGTHNGPVLGTNDSPALYGTATYGDYGVLATGDTPEPLAETPFPLYDGPGPGLRRLAAPTIFDVARRAGASKSTVSKVLTRAPRVSQATRGRVGETERVQRQPCRNPLTVV